MSAEAELRQYLANDSAAARRLDRDDDDASHSEHEHEHDGLSFATADDDDDDDDETKATTNSILSDSTTRSHTIPPTASAARDRATLRAAGLGARTPGVAGAAMPGGGTGGSNSDVVNTGPKGVREDARAFEAARDADDRERRRANAAAAQESERRSGQTWSEERMLSEQRDRWVEKRLKQLSKQRGAQGAGTVGRLARVDAAEYLELVEGCDEVCVLVVDLEGDDEGDNEQVAEALSLVARRYPGQRFVSLDCAEAEMDPIVCPALLHYLAGDLVNDVMRLIDEIPTSAQVDRASIERVLLDNGILASKHRLDGSRD